MDIMIYDEEADRLQHITFAEALYACCVGDGANQIPLASDVFQSTKLSADDCFKCLASVAVSGKPPDFLTAAAAVAGAPGDGGDGDRGIAAVKALVTGPVSAIISAVNMGVWVPVCITIARPFIEHLMMSAIMTVSGRDTGATLFGPAGKSLHPFQNPRRPHKSLSNVLTPFCPLHL
jgi:hypothetical protein